MTQTGFRELRISAQDGQQLYYRDYGDPLAPGRPLLCLPGLARNCRDYHPLALRHASRRRVVCPDYRGRGQSSYDSDWRKYRPEVYLSDLSQLLAAANLHGVVVVGTSMGGLLAMGMAIVNPTAMAGVVLNDVGPEIEPVSLARIRDYVGRATAPANWDEALAEIKEIYAEIGLTDDAKWHRLAEAIYREDADGRLQLDWDPQIAKSMGQDIPDLWPYFRALRRLPVLAIRGALSSVLSTETFAKMAQEMPDLKPVTVPGVGHAPLLDEPQAEGAIDDFLERLDG